MMQLQFEKLDYQLEAVDAVLKLFQGQPNYTKDFQLKSHDTLVNNHLDIAQEEIEKNLLEVQRRFHLPATNLKEHGLNFAIEMETGTGKTYVYLRTIFELNREYGWTKFVIIVPSVAIREGVLQSLSAMEAHFESEFNKPTFEHFVYSRARLNKLDGFAADQHIKIMIINIDAFNKDINVINRVNESGEAPINYIRQTCPIVILDEPQNMESEQAKKSINSLNPLFILRYSATHKQPYHKIYSLNAVDAYNKKLVKQIEVEPVVLKNDVNGAYLVLKRFLPGKGKLTAEVELHVRKKRGIEKKSVKVHVGEDLYDKSGGNECYRHHFIVNSLDAEQGTMELSGGQIITQGENHDALRDEVMKMQIRLTIEEHLKKEERLRAQGIKVLSLFFIDKVANYRNNGKFAQWFKELYESKTGESAEGVHDGYFSQDKDTSGKTKADEDTYSLIMKDKEKLLSFESPLRFIFSHSALKEGWDNPNVFQICTLNETQSLLKKRQELGRGLRLAVNQQGERIHDESINILTVIANESYESFAANLQKEYEEDGIEFKNGGAQPKAKRQQQIFRKDFTLDPLFVEIWQKLCRKTRYEVHFEREQLIERACALIQKMPEIQKTEIVVQKVSLTQKQDEGIRGTETMSHQYASHAVWNIPDVLLEIQRKTGLTRQTIFEILQGSDRIKELAHNPQRFVDLVSEKIMLALNTLMIDGIQYLRQAEQDEAVYTQSLAHWERLAKNGTEFFENKFTFAVDQKDKEKLRKTIFANYIDLDSQTEHDFARDCENYEKVAFYFKLPGWFKVPTPIGNYNPDWAVVMNHQKQVYFVAETKNTGKSIQDGVDLDQLRQSEQQKIECAKQYFKTCGGVRYRVVEKLNELTEAEN